MILTTKAILAVLVFAGGAAQITRVGVIEA